MSKQIAILRGINVGGKRRILMADLKQLFKELGFVEIQTYIQSGNVIFSTDTEHNNIKVADEIEDAIHKTYGFEVPIIVRTAEELNEAVSGNPYLQDRNTIIDRLHLTFLKQVPDNDSLEKINAYDYSPDKFVITDNHAFIYCSGKYHKSKLSNTFFERKLKVSATTRNWKTVLKLLELSVTE